MTDAADHIVLTLPRGQRGELRVGRFRFKGNVGTKLQFWYPGDDDDLKPGRCVTLRDDELPQVIAALERIVRKVGNAGSAGSKTKSDNDTPEAQPAVQSGRRPTHTTRVPVTCEELDAQEVF